MVQTTGVQSPSVGARLCALTEGWRKHLCAAARIDEESFQVGLGAAGLVTADSSGLMAYADLQPPPERALLMAPPGRRRTRSAAYLSMLHALLPASETGLRSFLGGRYASWIACRNAELNGSGHQDLFRIWSENNLAVPQAQRAQAIFAQHLSDPLQLALEAFEARRHRLPVLTEAGRVHFIPGYNGDIAAAQRALSGAPPALIAFDSARMGGPDPAEATGAVMRFGRYFWGRHQRPTAELRRMDAKAVSHRITVTGRFGAVSCLRTRPLGWFDAYELFRAWSAGDDPQVWDMAADPEGWQRFFRPDGVLARRIDRLVLVAGFEVTVTSHAPWDPAEVRVIRSEATGGVWPFFAAGTRPTHRIKVTHNPDGSLSHHLTLARGAVQVLGGVTVEAPD